MSGKKNKRTWIAAGASVVLIGSLGVGAAPRALADAANSDGNIATTDLSSESLSADDLAQQIAGDSVDVSNATFTGADDAAGTFDTENPAIIGFGSGVVLSSGNMNDVAGANYATNTSTNNAAEGSGDLNDLTGSDDSNDAATLDFDFVPTTDTVAFNYVFGSEEYKEFVNTQYDDVFGFFINGNNCAETSTGDLVSINTINPGEDASQYRDNPASAPTIDTELDGLTTVLTCVATVTPDATNHASLAIADRGDFSLDSDVFIQSNSLVSTKTLTLSATAHQDSAPTSSTDGYHLEVDNATDSDADLSLQDTLPAGFSYVPGSTTGATTADPDIEGQTLTWGINAASDSTTSLDFDVTTAATPDTYYDNVSGSADGFVVPPTGDTAPIDVTEASSANVQCQAGHSCSATVENQQFDEQATIFAGPGGSTTLKMSFGAPSKVYPCTTGTGGVLTFSANRKKVIQFSFPHIRWTGRICWGQPTKFIDRTGKLTTHFNQANHEYEGALPKCKAFNSLPCIKWQTLQNGTETVAVASGVNDPRLIH